MNSILFIQQTYIKLWENIKIKKVGVAGFEPATSCSQSRRDNRATLYPEKFGVQKNKKLLQLQTKSETFYFAERKGFEPPVPVKVQLLSREPRSTTLAPLQFLKFVKNYFLGLQMYYNLTYSQIFFPIYFFLFLIH